MTKPILAVLEMWVGKVRRIINDGLVKSPKTVTPAEAGVQNYLK
jgi:hypothetical protein